MSSDMDDDEEDFEINFTIDTIPPDFIANNTILQKVCDMYQKQCLYPTSSALVTTRHLEYTVGNDIQVEHFLNTKIRENNYPVPDDYTKKYPFSYPVRFFRPLVLVNPTESLYIEIEDESLLRHDDRRRSLAYQPIPNISGYYRFNDELQSTYYDFVRLQNLNPTTYFNLEGATANLFRKMVKPSSIPLLNKEQRAVFDAVLDFFNRDMEDKDYAKMPPEVQRYYKEQLEKQTAALHNELRTVMHIKHKMRQEAREAKKEKSQLQDPEDNPYKLGLCTDEELSVANLFGDDDDDVAITDDKATTVDEPKCPSSDANNNRDIKSPDTNVTSSGIKSSDIKSSGMSGLKRKHSLENDAPNGPDNKNLKDCDNDETNETKFVNTTTTTAATTTSQQPTNQPTTLTTIPEIASMWTEDDSFEETYDDKDTSMKDPFAESMDLPSEWSEETCAPLPKLATNPEATFESGAEQPTLFECYMVKGSAGTGKTFILDALLETDVNMQYLTIKGSLVQDVISLYDAPGMTFCSFLCKMFSMNFFSYMKIFHRTIETLPMEYVEKLAEQVHPSLIDVSFLPFHVCLFVDEIGMIASPTFRFVYLVLKKKFLYHTTNRRILFLLAGDENQIQPIKAVYRDNSGRIEMYCDKVFTLVQSKRMKDPVFVKLLKDVFVCPNIKHLLMDYFPNICNKVVNIQYDFPVEAFLDYPLDLDVSSITDRNRTRIYFEDVEPAAVPTPPPPPPKKKKKNKDHDDNFKYYVDAIYMPDEIDMGQDTCKMFEKPRVESKSNKVVKRTTECGMIAIEHGSKKAKCIRSEHMKGSFTMDQLVSMKMNDIIERKQFTSAMFDHFVPELPRLVKWWRAHKSKFNRTIVLSKTNISVHNLNIKIFLQIKQLMRPLLLTHIKITQVLRFSRIMRFVYTWRFDQPTRDPPPDTLYILPLVVGMKYIMLTSISNVRLGSIVYLLGFLDSTNGSPGLIMITERDQAFVLYPTVFEQRVFKNQTLYGYPMCMAAASNIFNSQGKTLSEPNIYLDLQRCTINELFVAVSRPQHLDQIKGILV